MIFVLWILFWVNFHTTMTSVAIDEKDNWRLLRHLPLIFQTHHIDVKRLWIKIGYKRHNSLRIVTNRET